MRQFNKDRRVGEEIPTGLGDVLNVSNHWGWGKKRKQALIPSVWEKSC